MVWAFFHSWTHLLGNIKVLLWSHLMLLLLHPHTSWQFFPLPLLSHHCFLKPNLPLAVLGHSLVPIAACRLSNRLDFVLSLKTRVINRTLCPMRPPRPAPQRTLCPMRPPQPAPKSRQNGTTSCQTKCRLQFVILDRSLRLGASRLIFSKSAGEISLDVLICSLSDFGILMGMRMLFVLRPPVDIQVWSFKFSEFWIFS